MPRNRNRQSGPVRRVIVDQAPDSHNSNRPAANLLQREQSAVTAHGPVRRTRNASMVGAQKRGDGSGIQSDWAASPQFFTDPKWSFTAYTNKAV